MVDVLSAGTIVGGDFVVARPLDEGGMGAIYIVEQRSTGKTRALKVMHREIAADPELQRRFEQEARVGSRIKSEHVIDVVAAGVDQTLRLPYLVMELLDGEDLRHRVDTRGALSHEEVRGLFEQICHALAAAHAAGIVHRDIKPENVFVARSQRAGTGAAFTVKVLDFGIAKVTAEAGTKATRGAVGSPLCMAPEQTQPGPITPAADVWALGLLAYELVTGRRFWRAANESEGTTAQLLREIVLDPIPTATERARAQGVERKLPRGFDTWLARCLHRDPVARYANADLAWRAMRRLFDGTPVDSEAFAETSVAEPSSLPKQQSIAMEATGDAAAYVPAISPKAIPPETPIASTRNPTPPPTTTPQPAKGSRAPILIGAGIAIAGIAFALTRHPSASPPPPPPLPLPPPPVSVSAPVTAHATVTVTADPPASVTVTPPAIPTPAAIPSAKPTASAIATATASAPPPKKTIAGGYGDPFSQHGGAVMWKVQGRQIRLFTRMVSNESNVADAVVKKAIEWSSWQYLRCYERVFGSAKDLVEGTVVVSFEILDQLPRFAKVDSTTFTSAAMADCVKNTLLGETINAAGPDGKGKVVHAFKFVPLD